MRRDALVTPPVHANVLDRRTVIEPAQRKLGLRTVERELDRSELSIADEAFFAAQACRSSPSQASSVAPSAMGSSTRSPGHCAIEFLRGARPRAEFHTPTHAGLLNLFHPERRS
ncbi:MAG: hypothetical protein NZ553_03215 [Caldilinea sp.]|nr:hypothetical protein [Caldilinea sp.]MDW8439461.1 hypothetical protein [Caldilineaceae bacterium]